MPRARRCRNRPPSSVGCSEGPGGRARVPGGRHEGDGAGEIGPRWRGPPARRKRAARHGCVQRTPGRGRDHAGRRGAAPEPPRAPGPFEGGGGHTVTDGPFAETRELLAGYWLWQVRSLDEATEWIKRAPFPP